jgi:hypothetical protein
MTLDPSLFRPEAIDDESRELIESLRALAASQTPMYKQTPEEVRAARAGRGPGGVELLYAEHALQRTMSGPAGDIP